MLSEFSDLPDPIQLKSIEAATQATLILETFILIVQLQQKTEEKTLDVPLPVRNTAQQLLGIQLVADKIRW